MKRESLVIADQHAAVNMYLGFVHTARHAPKGNLSGNGSITCWDRGGEGRITAVLRRSEGGDCHRYSLFADWSEVVTR